MKIEKLQISYFSAYKPPPPEDKPHRRTSEVKTRLNNKEEKCKTRLFDGFHFWKATADLNEPLKSARKVFAADRLVCAKNSGRACAQQLLD